MSVPNQIPESNYVGNGTTTTFAANFDYASDSDVFVTVNGVTPEIGQATFANGVFTFTTAPASGAAVRVYRSTPIERDTEYDNHDNVFRPRVVNIDFDRIWFVLQEYLMNLGITNQVIAKEIADRILADQQIMQHIATQISNVTTDYITRDLELKDDYIQRDQINRNALELQISATNNALSTEANERKSNDDSIITDYILRDETLRNYIDQTLGALLDLPDFQGIEAQFVKDASGKSQQDINDSVTQVCNSIADMLAIDSPKDGMCVYVKSYYAGLKQGGGKFVYSTVNTSVYDGGVCFGKWRRQFETLTPQSFGVIGGFSTKTLGDFYATLANAQAVFPMATELSNLHDRVAFSAYLQYLIANSVRTDWTCQILLDVPLPSYKIAKTTLIDGALELKSHQTYLKYCFHIATNQLVLTGSIKVIGTQSLWTDMRTRYIEHGVVCGETTKLELTGSAQNCDFGTIIGSGILGYALALMTSCHFSKARQVRGSYAGSSNNNQTKYLQGFVDDFTFISSSGSDINQRCVLQLTEVDILSKITFLEQKLRVVINNLPYDVTNIDTVNKQITIYPTLPTGLTTGKLLYVWGGALIVESNNTACTSVSTLEAIICGYGLNMPAVYGIAVDSFTSEFCGIGVGISNYYQTHIGTVLQLAYFEGNKVDILYGWSLDGSNALRILQTIALNPEKIHNMYAYTLGDTRRRDWASMGGGEVYLTSGSPMTVERSVWELHSRNTINTVVVSGSITATIGYNPKIVELTRRHQKCVNLVQGTTSSAVVTINAPSGYTVNGGSSVSFNMVDYSSNVDVAFYVIPATMGALPTDIKIAISGVRKVVKGTTAQRPSNPVIGLRYYDTTLLASGKPIEYNGTNWVDATGAIV